MARVPTLQWRVPAHDWRIAPSIRKGDKSTHPFYGTARWKQLRDQVIKERGRQCESCGSTRGRVYVDHIIELRDGGEPLDQNNLAVLCASCHGQKTARQRNQRKR